MGMLKSSPGCMKIVLLLTAVVVPVTGNVAVGFGGRPSINGPAPLGNLRQASALDAHDTGTNDAKLPPLAPFSDADDENSLCVAITGGAGQIAYSLLPLILHGRVFGETRKVRLRLLDVEACAGALEGVAMEIRDCRSTLVTEVVTTTDPETAFAGADVAILLGGFPRLPGMERRDLIAKNVPIMAEHGRAIAKCARAGVRVLVVANPACTNCLVASACAPSVPRQHFSSLARLDQQRLEAMVAERVSSIDDLYIPKCICTCHPPRETGRDQDARQAGPTPTPSIQIRGCFIWGNHSPTMWSDVSRSEAKFGGAWVPVERLTRGSSEGTAAAAGAEAATKPEKLDGLAAEEAWVDDWATSELVPAVRERGTKVMETRGKSSALSAANAIANHLRDWLSSRPSASKATAADEPAGGVEGRHGSEEECHETDQDTEDTSGGIGDREEEEGYDYSSPLNHRGEAMLAAGGVSMGVFSDGNPYGVPDGLVYSFPVQCGAGRHRILEGLGPNKVMLELSTQELLEERRRAFEVLAELGLMHTADE